MYLESFDGTRIYYNYKMKGKYTLVFIHGWMNTHASWESEAKLSRKTGYSTITLDLRGHGKSDQPKNFEDYKLENFAKDIHAILTKHKIKKPILIGHSMGGMIALCYYKLYPENVKGLILCDTTYKGFLEVKGVRRLSPFMNFILEYLASNKHLQQYFLDLKKTNFEVKNFRLNRTYNDLKNTPIKSVFACLSSMMDFNYSQVLSGINKPVLIIQGEHDHILPKKLAIEMDGKIKNSQFSLLPSANHWALIQHPDEVGKLIIDFLEKQNLTPN